MVMKDQRWLCPRLIIYPAILLIWTLLTQTSSNYEIILSKMGSIAVISSTHLFPEPQGYRTHRDINNFHEK